VLNVRGSEALNEDKFEEFKVEVKSVKVMARITKSLDTML